MTSDKQLIFLAGIDGIGKTTFYKVANELFEHTERINLNRIVSIQPSVNLIDQNQEYIFSCLDKGQSLCIETNLADSALNYQDILSKASSKNYYKSLYYIDTYDLHTIYNRNNTTSNTSHISRLENQFKSSHKNLFKLLNDFDQAMVVDNTDYFEVIQIKWS